MNYRSFDLKMMLNYMVKNLKKSSRIELENSGYSLAGCDQFKSEILAELRRVKHEDLEDMI